MKIALSLILTGFLLVGCGLLDGDDWPYTETPVPPPDERGGKPLVMVVGDSIAAGWTECSPVPCEGIELDWWQDALGEQAWVLNRGVGNSTTADLLERWERDTRDADIVIIVIGINDVFRDVPAQDILTNLETMRRRTMDAGKLPIFATLLPFDSDNPALRAAANAVNDALRGHEDWLVLDLFAAAENLDNPGHPRQDEMATALHPNTAGYARLADYVREWWAENQAVLSASD